MWQPAAQGNCELCSCLEKWKTADYLSKWFFNFMLSKRHFFFCVFGVLFCLLWWVFVCLVRFLFFVWHSCRDMAWIMLTEAFKGKSCSSFFAAVGAFAACSGMQERSIMGQWTLEGSASTLHQVWPSREMVVERGLADKVKFHCFFCFVRLTDAILILMHFVLMVKQLKPWGISHELSCWSAPDDLFDVWIFLPALELLRHNEGILWLCMLLETEVFANCLKAGYIFPLGLDFKGRPIFSF